MRPPLGLGDLVRAWHATGCQEDALLPLAQMLGLTIQTAAPSVALQPPPKEPPPSIASTKMAETNGTHTTSSPNVRASVVLEPLPHVSPPQPAWLSSGPLRRPSKESRAAAPPLFNPMRERALLATIARQLRPDGDIDVRELVHAIARLQLPRRLPRRFVPSLRGGVQLLIDRSEWMLPFDADAMRLVERFRSVVGDALEELWITQVPPAVLYPNEEARPWAPPMPGTAVVVVSDLGRAAWRQRRRHPRTAWLDFVTHLDSEGFAPILIVPGRRESYADHEPRLRGLLLLGWDRSARVAEVAHSRRRLAR